jgi:hypothetical protein
LEILGSVREVNLGELTWRREVDLSNADRLLVHIEQRKNIL